MGPRVLLAVPGAGETLSLWDPVCSVADVADFLDRNHYLGRASRGFAWSDEYGVAVLAHPNSRNLPHDTWLELIRWCLVGTPNGGSRQWKQVVRWLRQNQPHITTVVSYSDPSAGHTGSLYRACNWRWAPTWHRLRPPPTGNGQWVAGQPQAVKDRWVYPLRKDAGRPAILAIQDEAVRRAFPGAEYTEVA